MNIIHGILSLMKQSPLGELIQFTRLICECASSESHASSESSIHCEIPRSRRYISTVLTVVQLEKTGVL